MRLLKGIQPAGLLFYEQLHSRKSAVICIWNNVWASAALAIVKLRPLFIVSPIIFPIIYIRDMCTHTHFIYIHTYVHKRTFVYKCTFVQNRCTCAMHNVAKIWRLQKFQITYLCAIFDTQPKDIQASSSLMLVLFPFSSNALVQRLQKKMSTRKQLTPTRRRWPDLKKLRQGVATPTF